MKLLVTGCARSGNTLMKELCHVGFGLPKTRGEQDPRTHKGTLFKLPRAWRVLGDILNAYKINVIFMLRDPKSVLISRHLGGKMVVTPDRWVRALKTYEENERHPRLMLVKFEALVKRPDQVQKDIAEKFVLDIKVPFSECWKDFDAKDASDVYDMRGIRPIDPSRIDTWLYPDEQQRRVLMRMREEEELKRLAKKYGYDMSVLKSVRPAQ